MQFYAPDTFIDSNQKNIVILDHDLGSLVEFKPLDADNKDIMESNKEISNKTRKFKGLL